MVNQKYNRLVLPHIIRNIPSVTMRHMNELTRLGSLGPSDSSDIFLLSNSTNSLGLVQGQCQRLRVELIPLRKSFIPCSLLFKHLVLIRPNLILSFTFVTFDSVKSQSRRTLLVSPYFLEF